MYIHTSHRTGGLYRSSHTGKLQIGYFTSSLNTSVSCLYLFLYQTSQIINFINQPSGPNLNTSVSFVNLKKTNQCNLEGKLRKLVKSGPRQCQLTMVSQHDDGRSISLWQLIVLKEINNDNIRSSNAFCCKLKNEDDFLFLKLPARWLWRVRWASQPNWIICQGA